MTEHEMAFAHDIRDDLTELAETHNLDREQGDAESLLVGDGVLVAANNCRIDFGTGRIVADLRVETPYFQSRFVAEEISVYGIGFTATGREEDGRPELRVHSLGGGET